MPVLDDWDLDEELRHIGRLLLGPSAQPEAKRFRLDAAHALAAPHGVSPAGSVLAAAGTKPSVARGNAFLTWAALLLGTMSVFCGGALVLWSWVVSRPDLWRIGQPVALAGVVGLVIALVLQLDAAWDRPTEAASDENPAEHLSAADPILESSDR